MGHRIGVMLGVNLVQVSNIYLKLILIHFNTVHFAISLEAKPVADWKMLVSKLRMIVPQDSSFVIIDSYGKIVGSQHELTLWKKRVCRNERTNVLTLSR